MPLLDNHTHSLNIGAHTHSITIPNHTHDIQYGIYMGTTANAAQIKIDGKLIPMTVPVDTNFNVASYLSVDGGGKIQRGTWHTIEIIPNSLTRIEASIQNIVFINPRGGSDL